jgi:tetratricopeptide (TPR) repeat protein
MAELIPPDGPAEYEGLKERGRQATQRGEFATALEAYSRAREIALCGGDQDTIDEADLNVAMVRLQMGEARRGEEGLRQILLRARDDRIALAAAYHLASSLRKQGRHEKALAYARRALERARAIGAPDRLAMVHNLVGNILLGQSYLDEALAEYEAALVLRGCQGGDTRYSCAILLENLGYCLLLKRRFEEGMARIREGLDLAVAVGDRRCEAECLQDLCYGLLLAGQHREAIANGEAALARAQEMGYRDIEENCHYLLGELGSRTGDAELRDRHFQRLQSLHPELPFLKDFLCAVDVTQIITLKR